MRVRDYAQAASELIAQGASIDGVLQGLSHTMKKRGHQRLYPLTLRELIRAEEKRYRRTRTTVTVGRVGDISRHDLAIEEALMKVGATRSYETEIDPTIIGGFKVAQYHRMIDQTYKHRLIALYRSIIH